ncbi:MAG: multidrug efflux system outer membrane protein [Planctomycetota bacterium]|jgi:multidrug efflux system outer membrane protein
MTEQMKLMKAMHSLNPHNTMKRMIQALLPVVLLTSCHTIGPNYVGAPALDHQLSFAGASTAAPKLDHWWKSLKNRQLNQFVDKALTQNFDLRIAQERLIQSRAARRQVASAFLPQVSATSGYSNVGLNENTADASSQDTKIDAGSSNIDQWDVGADVRWEIDVFGGGRRQTESAQAGVDLTQERVHAARLATAAEVTDAFYTITGFREQIATIDENIRLQAETLDVVRQRADAGLSSRLDVQRATAQLESTRAAKPTLEAGLTGQLRRLTLLLGEEPTALDGLVTHWSGFPSSLPAVFTGLPAQLLTRRPDLRQAERFLAVATADIGVATANFYPRFYLLGQPQMISANTANLFDTTSFAWQFAPRIEWSIFSSGRNRALLDSATSRQREAMLAFEKAVLEAIGEVESSLAQLQAEQRRFTSIANAVSASRDAVGLAQQLNQAGRTNLIDSLVEEQRLNVLTLDQVRSQTSLTLAWVRLHQALGGGWQI